MTSGKCGKEQKRQKRHTVIIEAEAFSVQVMQLVVAASRQKREVHPRDL